VRRAQQSLERLCWSAWLCAACRGGVTPIGHLVASLESSPEIQYTSPEEIADFQVNPLRAWVQKCGHKKHAEISLPKLAEGSEPLVYYDERLAKVFKLTRPRVFGEFYYLVGGLVHQRNCSPLDYLLRLRHWKRLFGSAPKDLGITPSGQIVSTQKFISGTQPPQEIVDAFLLRSGLSPVKQDCWLWKKAYPDIEIWLGDARADNFVLTEMGVVPIDIRLWFV